MPQLVTGLYTDPLVAQSVIASLQKYGFEDAEILHLSPAADQLPALLETGLPRFDAMALAKLMGATKTLVGVRPPFGHAIKVLPILESYQGAQVRSWLVPDLAEVRDVTGEAAPFSRLMSFPLLLDDPAPFSRWLKWPLLSNGFFLSAKLGWKLLSHEPAPLSKALGVPTLSRDAAPFSRLLNLPTLSNNPAPFSSLLRWPTLY
jgi:hypothetical protein